MSQLDLFRERVLEWDWDRIVRGWVLTMVFAALPWVKTLPDKLIDGIGFIGIVVSLVWTTLCVSIVVRSWYASKAEFKRQQYKDHVRRTHGG